MSTILIPGGIITLADCYRYKGVTFEWHRFCGPMQPSDTFPPLHAD